MKSSQHIITGDSFTLAGTFLDLSEISAFDVSDTALYPDRSVAYVYGYGEYFLDRESLAPTSIPDTIPANPGSNGNWILKNTVDNTGNWIRKIFEIQTPEYTTYADLATMVTNSKLQIGKTYSITDFQTKHDISGTGVIFTGPTEVLTVMASSTNTFYSLAYSSAHPEDLICYDFANILCECLL